MEIVSLLIRLLLAGVFVLAACAKLADRQGSVKAVRDFGVPFALGRPIGILLPIAELLVAVALLTANLAWWGGLGALVLLLTFVVAITVNLALGRKPTCRCFGQLQSSPVGWTTLVRNTLLAACATFLVFQGKALPRVSVIYSIRELVEGHVAGSVLGTAVVTILAVQCWILFHLLRQHGRILTRIGNLESGLRRARIPFGPSADSLPVGFAAPSFDLPTVSGERATLTELTSAGRPVLLIFADPNCKPCNALLPEIARWQHDYANEITVAVISRGSVEDNLKKTEGYDLKWILLQQDHEIEEKYKVRGTPSAVLVNSDESMASEIVVGVKPITDLLLHVRNIKPEERASSRALMNFGRTPPAAPSSLTRIAIGEPAPLFRLPDLNGGFLELNEFQGHSALLLFWNPGCGFCRRMIADLKEWERGRRDKEPKLLVISAGTIDANREMQLRSTVVLDQRFEVGKSYGVNGTPSAVLIDPNMRIVSTIAVGAAAIFALATTGHTGSNGREESIRAQKQKSRW